MDKEDIDNSEEVKEAKKTPFFAGMKKWFYIGAWSAAGIAGLGFGTKHLAHKEAEDLGRAPDSVGSPANPAYPISPWLTENRLRGLEEKFDAKARADDIEHQTSRDQRARLDARSLADRTELVQRITRIEAKTDELTRDVKEVLDIMRRQPKKWSGLEVVDPETRAN